MKKTILILLAVLTMSFIRWHYNLDEAKQIARKEHKYILLNFSGSDWCGPCIRMHKEIFGSEAFARFADTVLVMVNADFPRMKRNQLPAQQQEINNSMADHYNAQGKFPYTVLLDEEGRVIRDWDGFSNMSPEEFTAEIRSVIHAER